LYNKTKTKLIMYPAGKTGAFIIPDGVTGIGKQAFSGCTSLTSITIPSSVTGIGATIFSGCVNLTRVTFQGMIPSTGLYSTPFWGSSIGIDHLRGTYLGRNGGIGTYTTTAPVTGLSEWTKIY